MAMVRAKFRLADGTKLTGDLTPSLSQEIDLGTIQPQFTTIDGQVPFWCGVVKPSRETLKGFYKLLGRSADKVFPILFSSDVELVGGQVSGELEGFLNWHMKSDVIHTIL